MGGFVVIDQRSQSKNESNDSPHLLNQLSVAGYNASTFLSQMIRDTHPHRDGIDIPFDSLGGVFKGMQSNDSDVFAVGRLLSVFAVGRLLSCTIGGHQVQPMGIVQFIRVFPTDLAAAEYTRNTIETKSIGEEQGPLGSKHCLRLTSMVKRASKDAGALDVRRVHVIKGQTRMILADSVVAAVKNVSTKVYISLTEGDHFDDAVCHLSAKALGYLDRQLEESRSTSKASMQKALYQRPDLTACAYCGKDDEKSLKSCSRCKQSRYCGVECQKKHFAMKGPFGHKPFCKIVVDVRN
jgi:hypothetical protein